MKKIGLLGGMSWESSLNYYKIINQETKKQLGGLHSAKIVLNSVDFEPIEQLQHKGDWDGTAEILSIEAKNIQNAGADFLLICTNTMHKVASDIEKHIDIPILHIADATAEVLIKDGIEKVGLLGTAFTMEQEFYKGRLKDKFNLDVVIPNKDDIKTIHDIIYNELCLGEININSKNEYLSVIHNLENHGAEAVILGCTEIAMLIDQKDTDIKLYDTTEIHAKKAVEYALR
ncbi:MAG: aspartate/glutamate racemase family protein [Campylobacterota bacterium]|nr:aspartate/glutamate racemase family protein [Campylobacterota bacterium]